MSEPIIDLKFIRLKTGDDIVATCMIDEDSGWVDMENPMRVVVTRMNLASKAVLAMMPWLPLELVANEYASVKLDDIITMVDLSDSFAEYYRNALQEWQQNTSPVDDPFGEDQGEDEEESPYEENVLQDILESLQDPKKRTIH